MSRTIIITEEPFGLAPREDGGKDLIMGGSDSEERVIIPFSAEAAQRLANEAGMSNERLRATIDAQAPNGASPEEGT